jgi:hypothetical protein
MTDYLIFARRAFQQPLELLGALRVEDEAQAGEPRLAEQARGQFGQGDWIEMIAIPRTAVVQVIPVPNP